MTNNRYEFFLNDRLSPQALRPSVRDIKHRLVLLLGASNSTGLGKPRDPKIDYTDPRIVEYPAVGARANQICIAEAPLSHIVTDSTTNDIGHAISFAREYLRYLPTTDLIVLLPCATTGIGMAEGASGSGFGGVHYTTTINHVNNALATLPNAELSCILWAIHGGNDVGMTDAAHQAAIDATLNGYYTQINKASRVPMGLVGYTPQGKIDTPVRATRELMFFGMRQRFPNRRIFAMTNQTGLTNNTGDTVHYNAASQRLIGKRLFELLRPVIV